MPLVDISSEDAATVHAVLMTQAEMQDSRSLESMTIQSRLMRDCPDEASDMIATLGGQVETFEDDCDDLRRIARLFPSA